MTPDVRSKATVAVPARTLLASCALLAAGLVAAIAIAQVAMAPPFEDLVSLAAYLSLTGIAAVLSSWLLLTRASFSRTWGLRRKAFLGSAVGGLLSLLNVLIIAERMFISTSHDLWVVAAALAFSVTVMAGFSLFVATSVAAQLDLIRGLVRSLAGETPGLPPDRELGEIESLSRDVARLAAKLDVAEVERRRIDQERRVLTASISHDLRTPVASIRAIAEALAGGVVESEADRLRYLQLLQREVERLGRMIDDLFDLAQLDAGALKLERRQLQLEEIVTDVLEGMRPQAGQNGVTLEFEGDGGLPPVAVDGARMERVVSNLVRNAIEHSPPGAPVAVSLRENAGWLVLTVSDSGRGFDPALRDQLWDRFYRGDPARTRGPSGGGDGVGLGLSIVRGFVHAHGGEVEARSASDQGAVFEVRLPASQP